MDRFDELYGFKGQIDEGKPRERVLAGIGRKQGDQMDTLADRHGVVERTIRNWLDQFEEGRFRQVPYAAPSIKGSSEDRRTTV